MRSSLRALLAALAPALALAQEPPVPAAVETVERVVAVVDERPLLWSDARVLQVVRGLSAEAAREAAIDERLMHAEAARLPQADVSPEEEARALELLLEKRPSLRDEVEGPDLRRLLHRQIAIVKYVEFRFRPQVRVSDAEVRKAWEDEQAGRPAGPAFEDEQEELRARLERQALDERIEAWVSELRRRADVRYVGGSPTAATGTSATRSPLWRAT
jgi:hypothetical protein